jgi:hypothetical protein
MPQPDQMLYRTESGNLSIIDKDKRIVEVSLSSEAPVKRWGDTEILSHDPAHIRLDRLRTVGAFHLDHDTTKRVAAIKSAEVRDRKLYIKMQFGRTQIADDAWKDVEDGILRGTSAGYRIHQINANEDTRTITAVDWEPFEGSFTTIPADPTVGVGRSTAQESLWRSLTTNAGTPAQETPVKYLRAILALCINHRHLEAEILARGEKVGTDDQLADLTRWVESQPKPTAAPKPGDEAKRADELRRANLHLDLIDLARTHQVQLTRDDLKDIATREAGLELIMQRNAKANELRPGQTIPGVQVLADGTDKRNDAAVDGLLHACFGQRDIDLLGTAKPTQTGMRQYGPQEIVRELLGTEAQRWNRDQIAMFASRTEMHRLQLRDANQSAANFATVLGNFADKAVLIGYNSSPRTHEAWTTERLVDDFKDVYGAAIASGLLAEQTSKGQPATEINFLEKSWNAKLGLFMRTIKFTYQDWRNDDLGLIADQLRNAGVLGANTEEWQVYKTLLALTWTNYKTTTAAFYDDTNDRLSWKGFGAALGDFESRTLTIGDEKIQLNPVLGTVIATPKRAQAARAILGQGPAVNGAPMAQPVVGGQNVKVVSTGWLANSTLTGYNADDYYLVAGNMDGMKVLRDRLYRTPRVMQIPAGSTPDMAYLVAHAFRAATASQDAMHQGDWA